MRVLKIQPKATTHFVGKMYLGFVADVALFGLASRNPIKTLFSDSDGVCVGMCVCEF